MSDYSSTEMMTIAAARALSNEDVCFVGIGAPSAACNLARLTHAPNITLIYESGTIGTEPSVLAAVHWRWGAAAHGADHGFSARDVSLLAAGRAYHHRLSGRRAD